MPVPREKARMVIQNWRISVLKFFVVMATSFPFPLGRSYRPPPHPFACPLFTHVGLTASVQMERIIFVIRVLLIRHWVVSVLLLERLKEKRDWLLTYSETKCIAIAVFGDAAWYSSLVHWQKQETNAIHEERTPERVVKFWSQRGHQPDNRGRDNFLGNCYEHTGIINAAKQSITPQPRFMWDCEYGSIVGLAFVRKKIEMSEKLICPLWNCEMLVPENFINSVMTFMKKSEVCLEGNPKKVSVLLMHSPSRESKEQHSDFSFTFQNKHVISLH